MPADDRRYDEFLKAYTQIQVRLMTYVRVLVYDPVEAQDVFQETSLVLWRKFSEFRKDGDFLQWAIGIARKQVLRSWRKTRRNRRTFSEPLLDVLAVDVQTLTGQFDLRQEALTQCIRKLPERQRDLIRRYYRDGQQANVIAVAWDRSVEAVYKSLKVLRRTLFECVERQVAEWG